MNTLKKQKQKNLIEPFDSFIRAKLRDYVTTTKKFIIPSLTIISDTMSKLGKNSEQIIQCDLTSST